MLDAPGVMRKVVLFNQKTVSWMPPCYLWMPNVRHKHVCPKEPAHVREGGMITGCQNLWLECLWGCTQQGRISLPGHVGDAVHWKLEAEIQLWEPMFCSTTPVGMGQNQAMLSLLPSGNTYQCSHVQGLPWVMPVFSCYSPWWRIHNSTEMQCSV